MCKKYFLAACFAGTLGLLLPTGLYLRYLVQFSESPGPNQGPTEISIPSGSGAKQISNLLEVKGVISNSRSFYHYLRVVAQKGDSLKAGDYEFAARQTPEQIIDILAKGKTKEIRFTIPEGASKMEIAQILENSGFGSKNEILSLMNDSSLISDFGVPEKGAGGQNGVSGGIEGYLFPDTYQFPKRTEPRVILDKMRSRLDQVMTPEFATRMQQLGVDLHEVLTLASVVEKETGDPLERPQIASVFYNRLERGMKLQTDPTVIYAITTYNGKITKEHLRRDNPYNTYIYSGLPPGPIASPGLEAIKSVLWPASTNSLYFVSRNNGSHEFCPDLKCHERAVKVWQIDYFKDKKNPGSTATRTPANSISLTAALND